VKKLSAILICLLMIFTCAFAGCAGFKIDKVKYYNEVLAKVGDEKITRYDLLNAYSTYGDYYVSNMGKTKKEALNETLNLLIDREALYQYAKTVNDYKPTKNQVNNVVYALFESVDNEVDSYIKTARNILNLEEIKETAETPKDTAYPIENYFYENNRRATLNKVYTYYTNATKETVSSTETDYFDVNYKIVYDTSKNEEEVHDNMIDEKFLTDFTSEDIYEELVESYLDHLQEKLASQDLLNASAVKEKVLSLMTKDLISYEYYLRDENGKEFSKNTHDLLVRYFERNFSSKIKDQYLSNIRTHYLNNETLSVDLLIEKYNSLADKSKNQYTNRESSYKKKLKEIGTDGDSILFHHENLSDGTEFGYFIHTLLNFSETVEENEKLSQKQKIEALDKNDPYYETDYADLISQTKVKVRDIETGELTEEIKTLQEVVEEYNDIVKIESYDKRLNEFIKFMFKYTGDYKSTLVQGMPYVVGTNGFSKMETAFTEEAISLMDKAGNMSQVDLSDTDTMCITSYGIHFLFFVEDVKAYDLPIDTRDITAEDLLKILNPLTKETYFDMLFEKVYPASSAEEVYTSNTGYSEFEAEILEDFKQEIKIEKFSSKIKGTKTSI